MRFVPQQFFPNSSRPELILELRVKEGASFAATTEQVKKMEAILRKDKDVRFFTAYTGAGAPRFYLSLNPELPNPGYAQFVVMTKDLEARERLRSRLMASVDQQFPEAWVRITRLELGPPVGFPVQFRVVGPDTQKVREIAREVEKVVAANPGVRDVQLDWNDPVRTLKVEVDQDKARALGLTPAEMTLMTQAVMNGATLSQLREGEDLVDIVARAVPEERLKIDTVPDVNLYTRQGTVVPLSQVARVETVLEEPVLWRRNRDMAITVRADVKDGEQGVSVTQSIRPDLKEIEARLPFGYRIDVGGAVEESDKANKALMAVAPVMLVTILTILMLQLQSFSLMTMVLLTAPLGFIGVVVGTAGHPCAARLRRDPRHHRLERHDHAQRGDPGRPGEAGDRVGPRSVECRRRRRRAQNAPRGAHRDGDRTRDGPAHAQRVLGPDGDRDHGRPDGRDRADDLLRAGPVRRVVQGRSSGCSRASFQRHGAGMRCSVALKTSPWCAGNADNPDQCPEEVQVR